ncbi:MAG TPA: ABC transporter ATP-binding protein [Thermoanaerobaculia bacterium]|nr:ABC transporter ATP-binding protein [Thermoanaerobaculia bacterium]
MPAPPLLEVRDLVVEVPVGGTFAPAVDGVSFDLAAGEAVAIVGESGCGKTLLGRALLGLAPERARVAGSIRLRGHELAGSSEEEWRRVRGNEVALVFQEPAAAFDPVATIGSQIVEAVRAHQKLDRRSARALARERLHEVGFPDPDRGLDEYAHRLSGGLRQRAFLAMALASDPAILVADEPTTALDATVAAQVLELLDRLRRERALALLLISHDLGVVARHAGRVIVMYAGRVAEQAPAVELFRAPRHPYTRGLLASRPRLLDGRAGGFPAIAGTVPDLVSRPRGRCAFEPRCPDRFEPCDAREPALYPTEAGVARCFLYERNTEHGAPNT